MSPPQGGEPASSLRAAVAQFVLGAGEPPAPEVLRAAGLGAYAYTVLPSDHPFRAALRGDYLAALARHQGIKRELAPLIAAWREAGIEVLFFKGFHLAEFVYPVPGARFHGDVDVVLREADLDAAARIAAVRGWRSRPGPGESRVRYRHGAYDLWVPGGLTQVDVQRFVVHSAWPWTRAPRRLTEAVWSRSVERVWEGTTVRVPDPVDALLVCLVLHRSWEAAPWLLKVYDPIDFRLLGERGPVTPEEVWARAKELGGERTLAAFLERCDPWAQRWITERPGRGTRLRLTARCWPERSPRKIELWSIRLLRVPAIGLAALWSVPILIRVLYAVRREKNLGRLLASLTPPRPGRRGGARWRQRTVAALRRLVRVVPRGGAGLCLVRALAVYAALRRQGWPVVFVSGVRRDEGGGVIGHAWVEYDGRPLPGVEGNVDLSMYAVNFRYPEAEGAEAEAPARSPARPGRTPPI